MASTGREVGQRSFLGGLEKRNDRTFEVTHQIRVQVTTCWGGMGHGPL
jgi:hypothetical protein